MGIMKRPRRMKVSFSACPRQRRARLKSSDGSAVLALEACPGGTRRSCRAVDYRQRVDGLDLAILDQDAAIHHDQLHVVRMSVIGEVLYGIEHRLQAERPEIQHDEVGAL